MSDTLTEKLKSKAHSLGFHLVGLLPQTRQLSFGIYEEWLGAGHHGEMGYLETERARQRRAGLFKSSPNVSQY